MNRLLSSYIIVLALILCVSSAAWAQATPPPPASQDKPAEPAKPPAQEKPDGTVFQSLAKKVSIDGQIRLRAEYRDPIAYSSVALLNEDDDLYLLRLRLNIKFAVNDTIDVFVQPQDSRTFGQETGVADNDKNLDLHQGWIEIRNIGEVPLTLKAGRFEMLYGDGRIISAAEWSNVARAWDGATMRYAGTDWWVDGFFTVIKEQANPAGQENDQKFFGLYGSYTGFEKHEIDVYALNRRFPDLGRHETSIGARMKGATSGFDYTAEVVVQTGELGATDISAHAFALTFGYTFENDWSPRVGVEVTWASGDDDPTDRETNTFDAPFPFGHLYQGFADVFSWKNGTDIALYLRGKPSPTFTLGLDIHTFRLAEERDAWYGADQKVIRPGAVGASNSLGTEIDLHARVTLDKVVKLWFGWSHFFPGAFVSDTGDDPGMDWIFAQMTVDF